MPEGKTGEALGVLVAAAKFGKNPILKGLAIGFGSGFGPSSPWQEIHDSDVMEIEFIRDR